MNLALPLSSGLLRFSCMAWISTLVVVGSAGACSSSSKNDPPVSDKYCESKAAQTCSKLAGCCSSAGVAVDEAKCRATETSLCQSDSLGLEGRDRAFDSAAAATCAERQSALYDGCRPRVPDDPIAVEVRAVCSRVWRGNVALDGKCSSDQDCAPRAEKVACVGKKSAKTCQIVAGRPAKAGEPCGPQASGVTISCAEGVRCISGVCKPLGQRGEACTPWPSIACDPKLTCDPATKTCLEPLPVGKECSPGDPTTCAAPGYCDPLKSECAVPTPQGGKCTATAPGVCAEPSWCDPAKKTCVAPLRDGEACRSDSSCASKRCDSGTRKCLAADAIDSQSCARVAKK